MRTLAQVTKFRDHTLGSLTHRFLTAKLTLQDAGAAVRSDTGYTGLGRSWRRLRAFSGWRGSP